MRRNIYKDTFSMKVALLPPQGRGGGGQLQADVMRHTLKPSVNANMYLNGVFMFTAFTFEKMPPNLWKDTHQLANFLLQLE